MTDKNRHEKYFAARAAVTAALNSGSENATVSSSDLHALLTGHAPDPEPIKGAASFAAKHVPFLRFGMSSFGYGAQAGITISPMETGAVLCATDGHMMLLVRDETAATSIEGGCSLETFWKLTVGGTHGWAFLIHSRDVDAR